MGVVESIFRVWLVAAVPLTVLVMYLTLNKLWVRRTELAVVQSVSVAARLLALFAGFPYLALYLTQGDVESALKTTVVLSADGFLILIGIGFWVSEKRGLGFWAKVRAALRLERSEAGRLLRDVFHPIAAEQLVQILTNFALIDNDLDKREKEFIREFASRWDIDADEIFDRCAKSHPEGMTAYAALRDSVEQYTSLSPPSGQAKQLSEVLVLLSQADKKMTKEEEVMLDELLGMIEHYVSGEDTKTILVLIAPQSTQQLVSLSAQRDWIREKRLGGDVLRIGQYYSRVYAEMICEWYRKCGYLTVTAIDEETGPAEIPA